MQWVAVNTGVAFVLLAEIFYCAMGRSECRGGVFSIGRNFCCAMGSSEYRGGLCSVGRNFCCAMDSSEYRGGL